MNDDPYDLPAASHLFQPSWFAHAECRDMDVNLFFPLRGESVAAAKAACARCAYTVECIQWARAAKCAFGIFGGQSPKARRRAPIIRPCETCGVEFHANPTGGSVRKFCGADCRAASRARIRSSRAQVAS